MNDHRPLVIADHVWDSGYVRVAYCPPFRTDACFMECKQHEAYWRTLHVHELAIKTTDSGHVVVRYPDGSSQELVRQGGPRHRYCQYGCPYNGKIHSGPCLWTH